jgi:hypothetical protein
MHKRALTLILPVFLVASFGFTVSGCDKKEEKKDEKADKKRRRPTAAGSRHLRARELSVLVVGTLLACGDASLELDDEPPDEHELAQARLLAWETEQRNTLDFAAIPASDGRFGPDPYRVIRLPDGRLAALLRGADQLVLLDARGVVLRSVATPHDPTDLVWRDGELLVVGTGEARVARHDAKSLEPLADVPLPNALAPRTIATAGDRVWVADEALGELHELVASTDGYEPGPLRSYCHGPIALRVEAGLLIGNCLLEHRLRVDRIGADQSLAELDLAGPRHDGPIWSFEFGPPDAAGTRLLALTGVEDRPLDRSEGGFGYIDSFVYVYALTLDDRGLPSFERRASINTSELGVVTPKWSRWRSHDETPSLLVAGYATAPFVTLSFTAGVDTPPQVEVHSGLPGTTDTVQLTDGSLLAVSPLLDRLLLWRPDGYTQQRLEHPDDRSFEQRLGEALVFTTAMAPRSDATGSHSRFTCETCHFEGRGDGRVHYTGREFQGQKIHAVSKSLLGLFPNRPYFSRALDRTTSKMVDNEFRVANHHSELEPYFVLDAAMLPWLRELPGWPRETDSVDGETLRRALMRFLLRYSTPSNPATRGRNELDGLEAEGAKLFARHCESCHQARLVTDDAATRIPLGQSGELEPWRELIFSANAPIVWASEAYAQTGIVPWVHPGGARVPSLRRLYLDWPYFTNGRADSLAAVLEGIRLGEGVVDHQLGPAGANERGLDEHERAALLAFLRLL